MVRSIRNRRPLDNRWELVEIRDSLGRPILAACPRVGAKFGGLTVVLPTPGTVDRTSECRCSCGSVTPIDNRRLLRDEVSSCRECGYRRAAGKRETDAATIFLDVEIRRLWQHRYTGVVSRCTNPECDAYPDYGGRGIGVHPEWLADRIAFYRYAITLPGWDDPELDIDRIDNNGGYVPGNLRLVPRQANTVNRRNTVRIEFDGANYSLPEFAAKFCPEWHRNTVRYHLNQGRQPGWIVDAYKNREGL